ncbi:MAG: Mov34/MPN/PAD-1 family protein [Bosea sp. (in: a-proteobacteria)]|uniref:Mov34/MPN/PAD-1 family protein n=1 Tax=Bosea sp. (in: a-proteobacteria) TaxID=1871050 RepID=UPI0027327166|nr:Mov34/MPN/PAD-1 family protein [Bosea sp. (in: a-proteobacteria)]MDP3603010.1 Mov34/MPN/PAD-1 family protein [Bosea sp. (in: a-proteobacteria)]
MTDNEFTLGSVALNVSLRPMAIRTFEAHRQMHFWHREAGGQLFGVTKSGHWTVMEATGPRTDDKRGRFSFWPSRAAEQKEIEAYHARGLEYLGDWHTHPESRPTPSLKDIDTIQDIVRKSQHHLPGFLLCIIGRSEFTAGLWMSFHDRVGVTTRLA